MVIVIHGGPGGKTFLGKLGASEHEFDKWFGSKVLEIHGMDITKPPPGPPPVRHLSSGR